MNFLRQDRTSNKNFLSERVGDLSTQCELSKLFKPVTKAITFSQFSSITACDDDGEEEDDVFIGDIAEYYLRKFATVSGADKTFGLRDKDGKFDIGNKEGKIKENNIIAGNKEYAGTPGLWELIVA